METKHFPFSLTVMPRLHSHFNQSGCGLHPNLHKHRSDNRLILSQRIPSDHRVDVGSDECEVLTVCNVSSLQICVHVLKEKKCHYIGNCSFAHSQEEKELWTYMKNTGCEASHLFQFLTYMYTLVKFSEKKTKTNNKQTKKKTTTAFPKIHRAVHCFTMRKLGIQPRVSKLLHL